ncbi:AgmX/PglI C-terminal domain-containing protein [Biformimicrobium ophioploci]|uniref:AgmX/PglI C-terminal domain-containing protein n=1 Tax=Biformimicrobium ophioploci TaxID=3036711 RepID=A0ABQ6M150_9GAMM|nr:AgmX/PglI C-terminal domain-containing protein [Microbulbifer sp. NKW57]GMG88093.1 hypothetical protein MNKW57_24140 [Microbulbifer sp. NKW57]
MQSVYPQGGYASLAWPGSHEEDSRFQRILRGSLIAFALLAVVISFVPVPELSREQAEKLPPQLAKVVLEKKELPKPKPAPKPKVEKPKEEKKPEEKKPEEKKPDPKVEKPKPKPAKVELAREKAKKSGVLQFQDDLLAMRDAVNVSDIASKSLTRGDATAKKLNRNMISDKSRTVSGGVNTGGLSTDTGGVALAGRETTVVESDLASGVAAEQVKKARKQQSARTDESIRQVIERNKGAIFAIYNRALRRNPALAGKLTVQMVIQPDGSLSGVKVVQSELGDSGVERKLLARIRLINFGAMDVGVTTLNYSFDFLPS